MDHDCNAHEKNELGSTIMQERSHTHVRCSVVHAATSRPCTDRVGSAKLVPMPKMNTGTLPNRESSVRLGAISTLTWKRKRTPSPLPYNRLARELRSSARSSLDEKSFPHKNGMRMQLSGERRRLTRVRHDVNGLVRGKNGGRAPRPFIGLASLTRCGRGFVAGIYTYPAVFSTEYIRRQSTLPWSFMYNGIFQPP